MFKLNGKASLHYHCGEKVNNIFKIKTDSLAFKVEILTFKKNLFIVQLDHI